MALTPGGPGYECGKADRETSPDRFFCGLVLPISIVAQGIPKGQPHPNLDTHCIKIRVRLWPEWGDSNARSLEPKSSAIPPSLHPDIQFSAMIAEEKGKNKFKLSVVIPVVKAVFLPGLTTGRNLANDHAARFSGFCLFLSRIEAPTLPNQVPNR